MLTNIVYIFDGDRLNPLRQTVPYVIHEGYESKFVQITKHKGVKTFYTKVEARRSLNRQRKAFSCDIGPNVYSTNVGQFGITDGNHICLKWGYMTEVVKTLNSIRELNEYVEELEYLRVKLRGLKIGGSDLHYNNVGVIRGRLVCLDFGDESIF
jgi:hypothetical protein